MHLHCGGALELFLFTFRAYPSLATLHACNHGGHRIWHSAAGASRSASISSVAMVSKSLSDKAHMR